MFQYLGYQLKVASAIEFPLENMYFKEQPDVIIKKTIFCELHSRNLNQGILRYDDGVITIGITKVGWFKVSAHEILCSPLAGVSDDVLALYCMGTIWAALMVMRGHLPFHGCGFNYKGKTALVLADSGVGKSTILHGMIEDGAAFITDDLGVVDHSLNVISLLPAFPIGKVSADDLLEASSSNPVPYVHYYREKYYRSFLNNAMLDVGSLNVIFVVDIHNQDTLVTRPLSTKEKIEVLVQHVFRPQFTNITGQELTMMKNVFKTASNVPIIKVLRPLKRDSKEEMLTRIKQILEGISNGQDHDHQKS